MSAVYFLIPGLRLPNDKLAEMVDTIDFSTLLSLGEGAEEVLEQTLIKHPLLSGATHLVWLWQVICKSSGIPETAAFEWEADGGPTMSTQTWRLWSTHEIEDNGQIVTATPKRDLNGEERDSLHDQVLACVRQFGFQLQQWEGRWYLTRKDDWNVAVRPWYAQNHQPLTPNAYDGVGIEDFIQLRQQLAHILKESSVNQKRRDKGEDTIDGFWPDGGSRRHLFKASTLRGVMSNDSFVWGWAQNAGLLNFRTTPVKNEWPDCPEGDLLAVLDGLYDAYRAQDWERWKSELPGVLNQLEHLTKLAQKRRCQKLVIVASGALDTHTVSVDLGVTKGLLARFKKKKPLDLNTLLSEQAS